MSARHTPGPWKADTNIGCKRISAKPFAYQQHKQAKRFEVASTPGLYDEAEDQANARLIAAAPELLEALVELCADIDGAKHQRPSGKVADRVLAQARAAIAKARGEA